MHDTLLTLTNRLGPLSNAPTLLVWRIIPYKFTKPTIIVENSRGVA